MNITGFTQDQKKALLDLLIVGMYADHNLASAEDDRVQAVLDTLQFESEYEQQQFSDAAFTRARSHANSSDSIRSFVTQLAAHFPTREVRRRAYDLLEDLLTSDGKTTSEESQVLAGARDVFSL